MPWRSTSIRRPASCGCAVGWAHLRLVLTETWNDEDDHRVITLPVVARVTAGPPSAHQRAADQVGNLTKT